MDNGTVFARDRYNGGVEVLLLIWVDLTPPADYTIITRFTAVSEIYEIFHPSCRDADNRSCRSANATRDMTVIRILHFEVKPDDRVEPPPSSF
jgi:hypothetical protein